jgi:hypothetical protein
VTFVDDTGATKTAATIPVGTFRRGIVAFEHQWKGEWGTEKAVYKIRRYKVTAGGLVEDYSQDMSGGEADISMNLPQVDNPDPLPPF